MYYAYKYRLKPSDAHREELDRNRDIYRQLYNHTLHRLNEYQDEHSKLPSMTTLRSEIPDLKKWWDGLSDVYSKVLQTVVERLFDNLNSLSKLKENGYGVGQLKWKPPREFRSFTYSQSGHQKSSTSGWQPEIGDFWRWLQARQEGRSDCPVTLETCGHPDTASPRNPRRRQTQTGHGQEGADGRVVRHVRRRNGPRTARTA